MNRIIAYGVLALALYKIFWDNKPKTQVVEQPKVEGEKGQEPKLNMTGFSYNETKAHEGVNGVYFEGNMNFFD